VTQDEPDHMRLSQRVEEVRKRYADDETVQEVAADLAEVLDMLGSSSERQALQDDRFQAIRDELAAERTGWQKLFELAPDALVVTNKSGLILEYNRRARDVLRLRPTKHRPLLLTLRFAPAFRPAIQRKLRNPVGMGGERLVVEVVSEDDDVFTGELRCSLVGADRLLWLLHDVSEARHAHHVLESAVARERAAAEQLRVVDAMRRAFLLGVSHDLRAPLAAIAGLASLLRDENLGSEDRNRVITELEESARSTVEMLRELLDYQRIEDAATPAQRSSIDVAAVVRRAGTLIDMDGHQLELQLAPTRANADGIIVERIISNLVRNAVQHTPPGTTIWIRCRREPDGVLLVVEDDGPGIAPDRRLVVFDLFNRERSPRGGSGLGVGLALVRRFAQLHGGYARVEQRQGGGASFHVLLAD
jgi:signal transduction histidine kinase